LRVTALDDDDDDASDFRRKLKWDVQNNVGKEEEGGKQVVHRYVPPNKSMYINKRAACPNNKLIN
jgi:hypothetical protein